MPAAVHVKGLRDLSAAFAAAGKQTKRELNDELRNIAEPIRSDAERLAESTISSIGPKWSKMRVGVTRRLVYVAPKQRGLRTRGASGARPNLAGLLARRVMEPALDLNAPDLERATERMLARVGRDWEHHG